MNRISKTLCALLIGCLVLAGCDKIEGDYYVIVNNEEVTVDFPDIDPASVYRKVLVEEFTGHRCVNCPQGHQILESLHQQYGDTLVTVGIHYGALAKPQGSIYSYDFRTEAGNTIGDSYNIDAIPSAIMNRNYKSGGWQREQWATVIREIDRSKVRAAVQIINEYDPEDMVLKANVKVTMLQDYPYPLNIVAYVIEDGVVKPQKDGSEDILDYVHNHVLRTAITDPVGFPIQYGALLYAGDTDTFAASINLSKTDWVPGNCQVVAFVYDPSNGDVLQVETAKVVGD